MVEKINWSSLPQVPQVMVDFISQRPELISLMGGDWRRKSTRNSVANRRLSHRRVPDIGSKIAEGYDGLKIPSAVRENLDALNQTDTLAIVTGQQAGLFGGPLYTYYKALTAILLARQLEEKAPGKVVPVFWMETTDADFNEIKQIGFPADGGFPHKGVYSPEDLMDRRCVGFHKLTNEIDPLVDEMTAWLLRSSTASKLHGTIQNAYKSGNSIAQAFRIMLTDVFGDDGLVVVDPLSVTVRNSLGEFWERMLRKPATMIRAYAMSSRELSALRLPLQVKMRTNALPVFHLDNKGRRNRILGEKDRWHFGRSKREYSDKELLKAATDEPQNFTPAVLLRPLVQDWLLPTWMYVAGPSEIAYHAQIGRAYDLMSISRPLVIPRVSVTLVEPKVRRIINKQGWKVTEVLGGREILLRRSGKSENLASVFETGGEQIPGWLNRIERFADEAGVDISTEIDRTGRKLVYQWEKLRKLTLNKIAERDKVRMRNTEYVLNQILPDGTMQERFVNWSHFRAIFGKNLDTIISSQIDLYSPFHYAIDLEQEQ